MVLDIYLVINIKINNKCYIMGINKCYFLSLTLRDKIKFSMQF
jgi:hypothetical protein